MSAQGALKRKALCLCRSRNNVGRDKDGSPACSGSFASILSWIILPEVMVQLWHWAHVSLGLWAEITRCGEGFANTSCPQTAGLGPQSSLCTGLRKRSDNVKGFGLQQIYKSEVASWYTIQMSVLVIGNKKYSHTKLSFLFHI